MVDYNKIFDVFMFRQESPDDSNSTEPVVTTGSIVWGVIIRAAIIIFASMFIIKYYELERYWWYVFFLLWFLVAWPAYRQYQNFHKRMEKFQEETLCGSCRHFDSTGQRCKLFDEHVSTNYIPCNGESWEPKSYEDG